MISVPYVSVIMTIYNAKYFISNSLNDLRNQTLKNIEIILIDDCSTDGTSGMILDIIRGDHRIKYIRNEQNCGAARSRNMGLKKATGEYIIFLDDDDVFDIHMLEKAYTEAKCKNSDIHVFRSYEIFDDGTNYPMEWSINKDSLPEKEPFSCYDVKGNVFDIFVWWCWDKLFKRNKIIENGILFQEIRTSNDLFFCCANYFLAERVSVTDDVLAYHNMTREGSLSNTRHLSYKCCVEAVRKLRDFLIERELYDHFKNDFFNYLILFFDWHLQTINVDFFENLREEMRKFIRESGMDGFQFDSADKTLKYELIMSGSVKGYQDVISQERKMNIMEMKKKLREKEKEVSDKDDEISILHHELQVLHEKINSLSEMNARLLEDNNKTMHSLNNIAHSRTWKITYPVRYVGSTIKKIIK